MDYEEMRMVRNQNNLFANHIGVSVVELHEGYAKAILDVRPEVLNPTGVVHGGCIYTMADIAATYAVASFGFEAATTASPYHYLAAAKGTNQLKAIARVVQHKSRMAYTDVEVYMDQGEMIGKGTFVHFIFDRRTNQ